MPHFYFDHRDNGCFIEDDAGLEFPTLEEARDQAARALAEMAKFVLPGAILHQLAIEVRDAAKRPVMHTTLRYEAVSLV
jgi:hypothetical protein